MVEEMLFVPSRMLPSECLCTPWLAYPQLQHTNGRQKFDFLKFRLDVATSLINHYRSRQRAANQDGDCVTRRNFGLGHWPTKVE